MKAIHTHSGTACAVLAFLCCCVSVKGADWPNYRGPNRDGKTTERIASWPPQEVWRATVGEGFSSVTVSDGRVYTMGWAGNQDTVYCFDEASTGNNPTPIWTSSYPCGTTAYNGTRGTPTIHSNEVYTFSHEGRLTCFNKNDGTYLWHKDITTGMPDPPLNQWGFGCSVLIEGDLAIINSGGYAKAIYTTHPGTHAFAWRGSDNGKAGYATPYAVTRGTDRTIVVYGGDYASGLNPADGSIRWRFDWDQGMADPILHDDKLWVSRGYRKGCAVVELGSGDLTVDAGNPNEWSNKNLGNKENCSVFHGGYVYGINENALGGGLRCVEFATGTLMWSSEDKSVEFGTESAVMMAGNQLVVINGSDGGSAGDGDLAVVEATPTMYTEVYRANDIVSGNTWTTPTLANGMLYLRSQPGTVVAYSVKPPPAPEMDVERAGTPIATGSTNAVAQSEQSVAKQLTFDIRNTGTADLTLSYGRWLISGTFNCGAGVERYPAGNVAPDAATALVVDVTPSSSGRWKFDVSLTSNDDDESSYEWTTEGVATDDGDGDGMRDAWEITYFGSTNVGPLADWDQDGFPNVHEHDAGTDPTNAASLLIATDAAVDAGGGVVMEWQSVSGKYYAIRRWMNLASTGEVVTGGIPASPPVNRHTNDTSGPRGYYRVELDP